MNWRHTTHIVDIPFNNPGSLAKAWRDALNSYIGPGDTHVGTIVFLASSGGMVAADKLIIAVDHQPQSLGGNDIHHLHRSQSTEPLVGAGGSGGSGPEES